MTARTSPPDTEEDAEVLGVQFTNDTTGLSGGLIATIALVVIGLIGAAALMLRRSRTHPHTEVAA